MSISPVSPETLPRGLWDNGLPPKGGGAVRTPSLPKGAFKVVLLLKGSLSMSILRALGPQPLLATECCSLSHRQEALAPQSLLEAVRSPLPHQQEPLGFQPLLGSVRSPLPTNKKL